MTFEYDVLHNKLLFVSSQWRKNFSEAFSQQSVAYVYDSYSRVASSTDGRGKTTSYSYDADDRITQVLTDNATSCTYSAGSCITYTFDNEGNLTSRVDRNGTTSFGYDWLNRQTSQTQPSGLVISATFDGAGNLTAYA